MTPKNPNWTELKKEPFGPYIADEILQYRSDEIERIIAWKAENPLPEPIDIEIGSNRGCFLLGITRGQRDVSTLGIELKLGLCRIAQRKLERENLTNGHVIHADAKLAIPVLCRPNSVNAIYVLFPDPWWKRKHARRRLLDDGFFEWRIHSSSPAVASSSKPTCSTISMPSMSTYSTFRASNASPSKTFLARRFGLSRRAKDTASKIIWRINRSPSANSTCHLSKPTRA